MSNKTLCIDVGTENCPCLLAKTGDCIICSRLGGSEKCDCDWQGVCVYNEFIQNGEKISNVRENFVVPVRKQKWYGKELVVMTAEVGKGFALKAVRPGSYVFLKGRGMPAWYSSPISVMRSEPEKGIIHFAVSVVSGKTKSIVMQDELELRGVYRNGLLGIKENLVREKGRLLVITKGVGFAPGVLLSDWARGKWRLDFAVDLAKIKQELVNDYLGDNAEQIEYLELQRDTAKIKRRIQSGEYDTVFVLASDHFIGEVRAIADKANQRIVCSNNFCMCCGEGVCGACSKMDQNGDCHKMCKCGSCI